MIIDRTARYFALAALVSAASITAQDSLAQWFVPWNKSPLITVVAPPGDPRIPLVTEAAVFWNRTLNELGSGFRLGNVTVVNAEIPEDALQRSSGSIVGQRGPVQPSVPAALLAVPGDLIMYLADSEFISFASPFSADGRRVVGIRGLRFAPMGLPNVPRNVIAHEIGHAIGLGYNADPALLMCGRPAACRPDAFRSVEPRMWPLSTEEQRALVRMYPATWAPR